LRLAITGSGGKTTLLFALAGELARRGPVWLAASTHLGREQVPPEVQYVITDLAGVPQAAAQAQAAGGVAVFTGLLEAERWQGLPPPLLDALQQHALAYEIPLLLEADGARQRPLKAHAAWEPPVPDWVDILVVVAGLAALGQPLDARAVHRPELFAAAAHTLPGAAIGPQALAALLLDAQVGGLKNAPPGARRVALLNQADTPRLRFQASRLAPRLLAHYERVLVAALGSAAQAPLQVYPRLAGIILAAGGARRMGRPKPLLPVGKRPVIAWVVQAARRAGLFPLRVVTGAYAAQLAQALAGWEVDILSNPAWEQGQSTSLRCGLSELPPEVGGAVFLQADQPFVAPALLHALRRAHASGAGWVIAPSVSGQRTSPVLFDRALFPELRSLLGDQGGRALFDRWPPALVPWKDPRLLVDIDTPADYEQALRLGGV
jgi:molybdenum cofactor cytidylyltransferase